MSDPTLRFALSEHDVSSPLTPDEMRTLADEMEQALIQSESQFSHPDWRYVDGLRALAGVPTLDMGEGETWLSDVQEQNRALNASLQVLASFTDTAESKRFHVTRVKHIVERLQSALAAASAEGQRDRKRLEWLFDEEATFTHDKETGEKYYRLHFDTGWCVDFRGAIDAARVSAVKEKSDNEEMPVTDDAPKVSNALTPEEWAQDEHGYREIHRLNLVAWQRSAANDPAPMSVGTQGLLPAPVPAAAVPGLIALANAALPADHPAKITREKIEDVRACVIHCLVEHDFNYEPGEDADSTKRAAAFLDALESHYLPPRE